MLNRYKIIILLLISCFLFQGCSSSPEEKTSDDTCIKMNPWDVDPLAQIFTPGFILILNNFHMDVNDSKAEGRYVTDDRDGRRKKRCDIPTDNVQFYYEDTTFEDVGGSTRVDCDLKAGDECYFPSDSFKFLRFRARNIADRVCIQTLSIGGWINIGCKARIEQKSADFMPNCIINQSVCSNKTLSNSLSLIPISSLVVECTKEMLKKVFIEPCTTCSLSGQNVSTEANIFPKFQASMRKTVRLALTLYVIFFGIRLALGQEVKKSDAFIFILKMALVIYFAVGFYDNSTNCGSTTRDGLSQDLVPAFMGAVRSLTNVVHRAASSNGLCLYEKSDYAAAYEDLFLWDALDCRIGFYLGLDPNSMSRAMQMYILKLILPALMAFQIAFIVFSICFAIFVLSITIYLVHVYILALFALTLVLYVGPIFIPMILFEQTRTHFDSWVKLLFAYTIQPAVIVAFLGLMLGVFDQVYYGSCEFKQIELPASVAKLVGINKNLPFFIIKESTDPECTSSFGYKMSTWRAGGNYKESVAESGENFDSSSASSTVESSVGVIETVSKPLLDFDTLSPAFAADMISGLLKLCLFAFLFYFASSQLSGFAADLTGANAIGEHAIKPMAAVDGAIKLGKMALEKYLDSKTGGAYSKLKNIKNQLAGDSGNSGTSVVSRLGTGENNALGGRAGISTGDGAASSSSNNSSNNNTNSSSRSSTTSDNNDNSNSSSAGHGTISNNNAGPSSSPEQSSSPASTPTYDSNAASSSPTSSASNNAVPGVSSAQGAPTYNADTSSVSDSGLSTVQRPGAGAKPESQNASKPDSGASSVDGAKAAANPDPSKRPSRPPALRPNLKPPTEI
jgi:type IV secretion system protein VirB6